MADELELLAKTPITVPGWTRVPSFDAVSVAVEATQYKLRRLAELNGGVVITDIEWTIVATAKGRRQGAIDA